MEKQKIKKLGYLNSSLPTLFQWSGYIEASGVAKPDLIWEIKLEGYAFRENVGMLFGSNDDIVLMRNDEILIEDGEVAKEISLEPGQIFNKEPFGEIFIIDPSKGNIKNKFQFDLEANTTFERGFCIAKDGGILCNIAKEETFFFQRRVWKE